MHLTCLFALAVLLAAAFPALAQIEPTSEGSIQLNLKISDDAGIDAVSEIVQFKNVEASEMEPFVRARISRYGAVQVNDKLNALIITDKQPKLSDLVRIVKSLDIEGMGKFYRLVTDVVPLRHTKGDAFPDLIKEVLSTSGTVKYNRELNTLIITDLESKVNLAKEIIAKLDHPVETRVIPVRYSRASVLAPLLSDKLSPDGGVSYQDDLNVLIVTDITSKIDYILNIIKDIDIPTPQILIEAKILEVSEEYLRNTGIDLPRLLEKTDFDLSKRRDKSFGDTTSDRVSDLNDTTTTTTTTGSTTSTTTTVRSSTQNTDVSTVDNDLNRASSWSSSLDISRVDQVINILKQRGNARIVANPSIIVKNNSTGQIFAGSTTLVAEGGTETGNARIELNVTPYTGAGNLINLAVTMSTSTPVGWDGSGNLVSSTQSLTSNVQIGSGESVVIGGLKTTGYSKQTRGVPVLEKVPLIKKLFTKNEKRVSYNELIVFLTPKVLKSDYTDAESIRKMIDFENSQTDALKIPPKQIEE